MDYNQHWLLILITLLPKYKEKKMSSPLSGWKNVVGSGGRGTCSCGSWKNHWINSEGDWPTYCSVKNCYERAEHGAHVKNNDEPGERIIPMCSSHNNPDFTREFSIKPGTKCSDAIKD